MNELNLAYYEHANDDLFLMQEHFFMKRKNL